MSQNIELNSMVLWSVFQSVSGFVLLLIRIEHDSGPVQFPFVPLEMISYDFPGLLDVG